jgi:hypothetical protein
MTTDATSVKAALRTQRTLVAVDVVGEAVQQHGVAAGGAGLVVGDLQDPGGHALEGFQPGKAGCRHGAARKSVTQLSTCPRPSRR